MKVVEAVRAALTLANDKAAIEHEGCWTTGSQVRV